MKKTVVGNMLTDYMDELFGKDCQVTETTNEIVTESLTTGRQYHALVLPYNPDAEYPEVELPMKIKIDPKKFKYDGYFNEWDQEISDQAAREKMTDYHYRNWNPLKIRTIDSHYYIKGPDRESEPMKRKFYNAVPWYAAYYDGKHGQTTEIKVEKETDISDPKWQDLVIAMVLSGDYTLQEALYAVATACNRCRHALLHEYKEYHQHEDGYSVDSKEYKNSGARCRFCSR